MFSTVSLVLIALAGMSQAPATERRCGWLDNPTPANWWLTDRDGEWAIGTQGGPEAPGLDELPDMTTRGWVRTNAGSYGYGCACLDVATDRRTMRITRIAGGRPLPLAQCRRDRALPRR